MKTGERIDSLISEIEDASIGGATVPASGLYHRSDSFEGREELRLDVDGRYPQMTVSGVITRNFATAYWIAKLEAETENTYTGVIWYRFGQTALVPYTAVSVEVSPAWKAYQRKAKVTFKGGGASAVTREYLGASNAFHTVEFEFDTVEDATAVTAIDTHAHPNRPAGLPKEDLTIETVYRRAGFEVRRSSNGSVPLSRAGSDEVWSDMEMHDAMQIYWSRFGHRAQWSLWVLTAALHERGNGLGGVMFDDIGQNHRQGTAIFSDSFISNAPEGDPAPNAWVARMRFWTGCHEMGHAFNLAHSWQKSHPPEWGTPWIPLSNEPEVRSFMNYPYRVNGGQTAFFSDFDFRFSDQELMFMRHAPSIFVQMGNADWFDHHGFEQVAKSPEPRFRLRLRPYREKPSFEFMEPPTFALELQNVSEDPQIIEAGILADREHLTVILKKDGKPARQYGAYTQICGRTAKKVLMPGDSEHEQLSPAAGLNGWDLAEPGKYTVQVAVELDGHGIVVSNPLRVRIEPPEERAEERLAQDFFSDEVGRVLAMGGSRFLSGGNDTLREVTERMAERRVAFHARLALANPLVRDYKLLDVPDTGPAMAGSAQGAGGHIRAISADVEEARALLEPAVRDMPQAAATIGHMGLKRYVDGVSARIAYAGMKQEAENMQEAAHRALVACNASKALLAGSKSRETIYA